jgi:hypothetical protein
MTGIVISAAILIGATIFPMRLLEETRPRSREW